MHSGNALLVHISKGKALSRVLCFTWEENEKERVAAAWDQLWKCRMLLPALLGSPEKSVRKKQSAKHKAWHFNTKSIPSYGSPQSPPAIIQVFVKSTSQKWVKVQILLLFLTALFLCPEGSPGCSPDAGRLPDEEGWLLTGKLQPRMLLSLCQIQTWSLSPSQPETHLNQGCSPLGPVLPSTAMLF